MSWKSTTDTYVSTTTPVTATPCTLCCWAQVTSVATTQDLISVANSVGFGDYFLLHSVAGVITAKTAGGGTASASSSGVVTVDTWFHAAAVFGSNIDRRAFRDGGNKGTNTTDRTPSGLNRIGLGVTAYSILFGNFTGLLAHVAIYNGALTDDDIASLGAGISPLSIKRSKLVFYCPMINQTDPTPELISGLSLTLAGGLETDINPRLYTPPPYEYSLKYKKVWSFRDAHFLRFTHTKKSSIKILDLNDELTFTQSVQPNIPIHHVLTFSQSIIGRKEPVSASIANTIIFSQSNNQINSEYSRGISHKLILEHNTRRTIEDTRTHTITFSSVAARAGEGDQTIIFTQTVITVLSKHIQHEIIFYNDGT